MDLDLDSGEIPALMDTGMFGSVPVKRYQTK